MLLQTLLARSLFFFFFHFLHRKRLWKFIEIIAPLAQQTLFVFKELFDAYGGNLRCFMASVFRELEAKNFYLGREIPIDIPFDFNRCQSNTKNSRIAAHPSVVSSSHLKPSSSSEKSKFMLMHSQFRFIHCNSIPDIPPAPPSIVYHESSQTRAFAQSKARDIRDKSLILLGFH